MRTYTTGELLGKIDIGQIAEMVEPLTDIEVKATQSGLIVMKDAMSTKHLGLPLPLTLLVLNAQWKIQPTPIDFLRALSYIKDGKTVFCELTQDGITKTTSYESLDELIHLFEAVEGKWFLEG